MVSTCFLSSQIDDIDRSNDMLIGDNPVQVSLTPPPNLKVEKIIVPNPSFSGKNQPTFFRRRRCFPPPVLIYTPKT